MTTKRFTDSLSAVQIEAEVRLRRGANTTVGALGLGQPRNFRG